MVIVYFILLLVFSTCCNGACNDLTHGDGADRRPNNPLSRSTAKIATYNAEWLFLQNCGTGPEWALFTDAVTDPKVGFWGLGAALPGGGGRPGNLNGYTAAIPGHITKIGEYLNTLSADIIVIQEVCDCASLEALVTAIDTAHGNPSGFKPWLPDHQGTGMKVGFITKIDPAIGGDVTAYNTPKKGFKAKLPIWSNPATNVYLYGVHFTAGEGGNSARNRDNDARALITEIATNNAFPANNIIVAGDFNGNKATDTQTDNPPAVVIDQRTDLTLARWTGSGRTELKFIDTSRAHPGPRNYMVVINAGQLRVTDPDALELNGKYLGRIRYRTGGRGGGWNVEPNLNFFPGNVAATAAAVTMCGLAPNVVQAQVTFHDTGAAIISGDTTLTFNGPNGVLNGFCNPLINHPNNGPHPRQAPQIAFRSMVYQRTWTVDTVHNQLQITADTDPRRTVDGESKIMFHITNIDVPGNPHATGNAAAAINRLNALALLVNAPASITITIERVSAFGSRLTQAGLVDADTAGAGAGDYTHYDCAAICQNCRNAGANPGHTMDTIDYIWYNAGIGGRWTPGWNPTTTTFVHTPNKHCVYQPPGLGPPPVEIYSDHDPITATFHKPRAQPVRRNSLPAKDENYGDDNLLEENYYVEQQKTNYLYHLNEGMYYDYNNLIYIGIFGLSLCLIILCAVCCFSGGILVGWTVKKYNVINKISTDSLSQNSSV